MKHFPIVLSVFMAVIWPTLLILALQQVGVPIQLTIKTWVGMFTLLLFLFSLMLVQGNKQ